MALTSTRVLMWLLKPFSKGTGFKENSQNSLVLPYTEGKQRESEIRELPSFSIATDDINYIVVTLTD